MSSKRKITSLTYADKLRAIDAVKSGLKQKDVAALFGIHESTLSMVMKKETELLRKKESGESLLSKRRKIAEYPIMEQCLFAWFKQCRNKNIGVSGPILKEKAEEFAKLLKIHNFNASNGWLENFKKRHDLAFKKMYGKSGSVRKSACQPEELNKNMFKSNMTFQEGTVGMLRKEEILKLVTNSSKINNKDDFSNKPQTSSMCVSINEARRAILTVRSFIEQCSNIKDNVFSSLSVIENQIDVETVNLLKQKIF